MKTDNQEDELLSSCFVKGGRKLVVGMQSGALAMFSHGDWGDLSDRIVGTHGGCIG